MIISLLTLKLIIRLIQNNSKHFLWAKENLPFTKYIKSISTCLEPAYATTFLSLKNISVFSAIKRT